jgi:hypothetical protein
LLFEAAYLATISWRFIVLYYKMAKVDKLMTGNFFQFQVRMNIADHVLNGETSLELKNTNKIQIFSL